MGEIAFDLVIVEHLERKSTAQVADQGLRRTLLERAEPRAHAGRNSSWQFLMMDSAKPILGTVSKARN